MWRLIQRLLAAGYDMWRATRVWIRTGRIKQSIFLKNLFGDIVVYANSRIFSLSLLTSHENTKYFKQSRESFHNVNISFASDMTKRILKPEAYVNCCGDDVISVIVKIAPIGTQTQSCLARLRRVSDLSISGRDILLYVVQCIYLCIAITLLRSLCHSITLFPLLRNQCLYCFLTSCDADFNFVPWIRLPLGFCQCSNKNCAYRDSNSDLSLSRQALCRLVHFRPGLDSVSRSAASDTTLDTAAFTISGTEYRRTVILLHRIIYLLRWKSFNKPLIIFK